MINIIFLLSFLILLILRMPIGFALGVSSLVFFLSSGMTFQVIPQIMATTFESFVLVCVPLFMLAGKLMNSAGITDRLFGFANKLVGHIKGGLGHVNILASLIFAGMTGSAVADAAGLGEIEIDAMNKEGYEPEFSAAVTAASSTVGPIIPPSMPMVIYGMLAGVSVGGLFVAGIIPGLIMGLFMMATVLVISIRRNYPAQARPSIKEMLVSLKSAILPLLTPIIILGGILSGVFTPTEAAAVVVLYAFILGFFVYKELTFKRLVRVFWDTGVNSAALMFIVGAAAVFGWILAYQGIPAIVADFMLSLTENKLILLLLINLLLLFCGCFLDTTACILIMTPVLLPIVDAIGVSRTHFGVIMCLNLMIGLITPPVGVNLFVVSNIAKVSFERTVRAILPFMITLVIALLIISFVPEFSMFLPNLLIK